MTACAALIFWFTNGSSDQNNLSTRITMTQSMNAARHEKPWRASGLP